MTQENKIRVAVLYGGRSAEHEVSLQSATNVIQYLDASRFEIIPVGIDKQGNWFLGNDVFAKSLESKKVPALLQTHHTWFTPEWVSKSVPSQDIKKYSQVNTPMFDVVFPAVHGSFCEDGTLQGLLELANVPYVGCGVLASAMGMDKDISKRIAKLAGINVVPYITIKHDQWQHHATELSTSVREKLAYPVFVKPANTGSSVGITKVKHHDQLTTAVNEALKYDTKVLIEKALDVFELEIAVLESLEAKSDPIVSVVGEVKTRHEFYSYDAKYIDEQGAELIIPAAISDTLKERARLVAKELFLLLECEGMARIDLFLTKDTQQIYFNEINTIPGFTQISMYPKLMDASGISYPKLLTHLIDLAIKKHKIKSQLQRTFAK